MPAATADYPAAAAAEPRPLLELEPVPTLVARIRAELGESFPPGRPFRVARSPGRLDVMGGIADYTGSLVCEMPLERAAAVAVQGRDDRLVQAFSFNLYDAHKPFTITMSLDDLARASLAALRAGFAEPGRGWGGHVLGCLAILADERLVDLASPDLKGFNLALYSTVSLGAGISSSAAVACSTMLALIDHFGLRERGLVDATRVAAMCQRVENVIVGAPCGIMDQVASTLGEQGTMMRLVCQPHELRPPLPFPAGVRAVGINTAVNHSVGGGAYGRTRCAAFMGHAILLSEMRRLGEQAGREMVSDPMRGYLANLDADDYKRLFRPRLPERMRGDEFIAQYGTTIDHATTVDPETVYHVQAATDHHVMEARRVREFARHLTEAAALPDGSPQRKLALDKAGHLMYASHKSYTDNAMLGAPECDLLVDLVRQNEAAGLYGAKITGGGSGGTVAILCDKGERVDAMLGRIMADYQTRTGNTPELFVASGPGGWSTGTAMV